jgi:two-component system, OmpR family, response regulator
MTSRQAKDGGISHRTLPSVTVPVWTHPIQLTVLVADPDPEAHGALADLKPYEPVNLVVCPDGGQALFLAGKLGPDVVLLSAELPVLGAVDVVRSLRAHIHTAIYLGIRAGEADAAGPALAAGATGVLSRPYEHRELDSLLRTHIERAQARMEHEAVLRLGQIELDAPAFEVRAAGRPLELTLREFEMLRFLILHSERAVTQDQIRAEIWGARGEDVTANTIAVHIGRLRVRLEGVAEIISIRGVGYRLVALPAEATTARAQA